MAKIKLTPTPELESRGIVAEQKSLDSRSIVAKVDKEALLKMLGEPEPKVEKPKMKTSEAQRKAIQKWQDKQSRMTFRMSPELREHLENHAAQHGESATAFIIRAIKEQMKRDNAE